MEDRETARMRKYGERKTTRIMMTTVPHVTSGSGLRKFRADGFLLDRVYKDPEGNSVRDTGRQNKNTYGKLRVSPTWKLRGP